MLFQMNHDQTPPVHLQPTVINLALFCNWLALRVVLGFKNENVHLFSNTLFSRYL